MKDREKEERCIQYYNDCISNESAEECGIPLLNISLSVSKKMPVLWVTLTF